MEELLDSDLKSPNDSIDSIVSPGGKSRYGRTRRPKVTRDFCDIDHVLMAIGSLGNKRASPRTKPRDSPESTSSSSRSVVVWSPVKKRPPDVIFDDDDDGGGGSVTSSLEMKVANNFKNNLQRGMMDSTIKERKFFKSAPEEPPEPVDVSKVLKIITNKSAPNSVTTLFDSKKTQKKSPLKTYSNRKKYARSESDDTWIAESFGLPDEPIIPLKSPVTIPSPNKKLDLCEPNGPDVNLPQPFSDFSLVNGMPNTKEEEMLKTCGRTSLKRFNSIEIIRARPSQTAKNAINGDKPGSVPKVKSKYKFVTKSITPSPKRTTRNSSGVLNQSLPIINNNNSSPTEESKRGRKKKNPVLSAIIKIDPETRNSDEITMGIETRDDKEEVMRIINQQEGNLNPPVEIEDTLDNNNVPYHTKAAENDAPPGNNRRSLRSNTSLTDMTVLKVPKRKSKHKSKQNVVFNPFSTGTNLESSSLDSSSLDDSVEVKVELEKEPIEGQTGSESVVIPRRKRSRKKGKRRVPFPIVKFEIFDYEVGDLVWAKLGHFPLWPCLVTIDARTDTHVRVFSKRQYPHYHVIFFGDNGRRAWVQSIQMHPYTSKYDLDNIAERLTSEMSPPNIVEETCKIRPSYLQKWTNGVEEAENIKEVSPELRLDCFLDGLREKKREAYRETRKRKSQQPTQNHGIKRNRQSSSEQDSTSSSKRQKIDTDEPKPETVPAETPEDKKSDVLEDESSDNSSSVPASLESQAAHFKRNNIFKGVPKEKVCQICERPGNVTKCRGPCNGVYHVKCAQPARKNVEIVSVVPKRRKPHVELDKSTEGLRHMTLAEKIDFRMKEIMKATVVADSTDSSSEEYHVEDYNRKVDAPLPGKTFKKVVKHVTADDVDYDCVPDEEEEKTRRFSSEIKDFSCLWCAKQTPPPCLVCHKEDETSARQKCAIRQCGRYYHPGCLKSWPQTQWSVTQNVKNDSFVCPRHVCHTCISDDPRASNSRCSSSKVVKCLRCPATYHSVNYCVPAGSNILTTSQMICTRHYQNASKKRNFSQTINANWCFICLKGGHLICCETCPTSVHKECLPGDLDEIADTFYCEDCQSGRLPLYDEIVWVKLGSFRWWPAVILFPNEVPDNVRNMAHHMGEFVVKFFGTYDHYWVGRGRTFLFQEGDRGHCAPTKKRVETAFARAIEEATAAHALKREFKMNKKHSGMKPPHYVRIKVNRPVGNVRVFDGNASNTTSCECNPFEPHPCGPDSVCLNRLLMTECNPEMCPAGPRCNNQCFETREYPPLEPFLTDGRGWGLKVLAPLRKGQFIIEYVGEMIDEQEYQRRLLKMHQQKEENYYFLTIDNHRMLDAGPKGNVARFMNHSCQPNCETQKWTVNGDTRVGLFAALDIQANAELTFNYNLECIGKEKKACICGAPNCSGFIGVKAKSIKQDAVAGSGGGAKRKRKKVALTRPNPANVVAEIKEETCFICQTAGNDVGACNNKACSKFYHLECVGLSSWPDGSKWTCPWHTCNFCPKRTIRCCVMCTNSYCPPHANGMIRHDKFLGFVCLVHDPVKNAVGETTSEPVSAPTDVAIIEEELKEPKSPPVERRKLRSRKASYYAEEPSLPTEETTEVGTAIEVAVDVSKEVKKSPHTRKLRSRKATSMEELTINDEKMIEVFEIVEDFEPVKAVTANNKLKEVKPKTPSPKKKARRRQVTHSMRELPIATRTRFRHTL